MVLLIMQHILAVSQQILRAVFDFELDAINGTAVAAAECIFRMRSNSQICSLSH